MSALKQPDERSTETRMTVDDTSVAAVADLQEMKMSKVAFRARHMIMMMMKMMMMMMMMITHTHT